MKLRFQFSVIHYSLKTLLSPLVFRFQLFHDMLEIRLTAGIHAQTARPSEKSWHKPQGAAILHGASEIGVTLDVCTHLGLEDTASELHRMEELQNARQEMDRTKEEAI